MPQRWIRRCACVSVIAAVSAVAAEAFAEPADLLIAAAEAARTQNYQGVAIYRDGFGNSERLKAVRIIHRYKNDAESERVTALNGEPCDIFHIDGRVFYILPKDHAQHAVGAPLKGFLRQLTPERLRELSAWYEFRALGEERIAARNSVGVAVVPRDSYRYGYEVWSDVQMHIPLKFSLVDAQGKAIEQVMYTEIDFPPQISDDVFTTEVNTAKFQVIARPEAPPLPLDPLEGGDPDFDFTALPPGFRPVIHDATQLADGAAAVRHTLLTDGLSVISVFSNDLTANPHAELRGRWHMGSAAAYGRLVGTRRVMLIGEVPDKTIRMIGDGMVPASPNP